MKKINRVFVLVFIIALAITLISVKMIVLTNSTKNIEIVLNNEYYSYLSKEAKEYVEEVYEETGKVILTEKNKKVNKPYLNPDYIEYLSLTAEQKKKEGVIPSPTIIDYYSKDNAINNSLPSSYDLRNVDGKNYVTPVRDQGKLGLCWTFASAGAAESYLLKTSNTTYSNSSQLISERQIDYATAIDGIKDYRSEYVSFIGRKLGEGGNIYISTVAMANGISLIDYKKFKSYNDSDLQKMELNDILSYKNSLYEVNETINMPILNLRESTDELSQEDVEVRNSFINEIKENITKYGAAYVSTYVTSSCAYDDTNLNNMVVDVYSCSIAGGGHAMQIIGWNDNIEYNYCNDNNVHSSDLTNCSNIINGKGVWILKNSWGDSDQYPYLTYDSLKSSISFIKNMTTNLDKSWNNNYILGTDAHSSKKEYQLSTTRIKDNEKIKKIKFISMTGTSTYNVKILDINGIYTEKNVYAETPGLITLEFDSDVVVNKDSNIIISTSNNNDGEFLDKVSLFTSNVDNTPYISLEIYENINLAYSPNKVLYLETKNVPSGSNVTFKLYNSENKEVNSYISYTNNVVAENNINLRLSASTELPAGDYRLDAIYDSNVIASVNVVSQRMQGSGTESDPYIIKSSEDLNQIRYDLDAYYILDNDIDLTEDTSEGGKLSLKSEICPQGFGWESINDFNGTLDGKGHAIKGLHQNNFISCSINQEKWNAWNNAGNGLFGSAYGNVVIKNLILEDFDVNCQGSYCSALLTEYKADNGDQNNTNEYNAIFKNIALKNSKVSGTYNNRNPISSLQNSYGGGLFGYFESVYGNISISNIYLDFKLDNKDLKNTAYLISTIQGNNVDINNISIKGNINGKYADGDNDAVLIYRIVDQILINGTFFTKNILSTVTGKNVSGLLYKHGTDGTIAKVNLLNIKDTPLCQYKCSNVTGINIYDKDTELTELIRRENYETWENFDENWVMKTIDGIPRIPVLKFVDFEYTKFDDIVINQELNKKYNIYDYLYPKNDSAKRITFKSNDESIVKINEDGTIIPQSTGRTTIHVESYYDGYINDVPITINYVPHYTVKFDANGGVGTMESIEVDTTNNYALPTNVFTKENYEFKEWNTNADGTGISYNNLALLPAMEDKTVVTLYVQWIGEEKIVTFDANGGTVNPDKKIVRYGDTYGDLPIPIKPGNGFNGWRAGSVSVNSNSSLYGYNLIASWRENAYTIIYDANGGTVNTDDENLKYLRLMSNSTATTIAFNGKEKELAKNFYKKSGYAFKEWNTSADGTGTSYKDTDKINFDNVENSTFRLYAQWELESYYVTFNPNGGIGTMDNQSFVPNVEQNLIFNKFTKDGYIFKSWNTNADGTGASYKDGETIKITNNLTLYAIWSPIEYGVTYEANNGTGNELIQNTHYGDDILLNYNTFTKIGYTFKEWNTNADGTGISYKEGQSINIKENIVLYAIWSPIKYSITYKANNGTSDFVSTQEAYYGESIILYNNVFSKDGYMFAEWNTDIDGTGTSYKEGQYMNITENLVLYAVWKETYSYVIDLYDYDDNENFIEIPINITQDILRSHIKLNSNYRIEIMTSYSMLHTGSKVRIYNNNRLIKEYTNVVRGDVNGDGKISSADYVKIRKNIMGTGIINDKYLFKSADVNNDKKISSADYVKIRKYIMNGEGL